MSRGHVRLILTVLIALAVAGVLMRVASAGQESMLIPDGPRLAEGGVDMIVMRDGRNEATLRREGARWVVGRFPVLQAPLSALWETAAAFETARLVAANPKNHYLMGVTPESGTLVQFWRGGELQEQLIVGHMGDGPQSDESVAPWSESVRRCYLRRPDRNEVYAVFCASPNRFASDPRRWSEHMIVEVPREDVATMFFTYSDEDFELRLVNSVWFVVIENEFDAVSVEPVVEVLRELERLETRDFPSEDEANVLGFAQPDASLEIRTREEAGSEAVLLLFSRRDDGSYHVKDASRPYIYSLSKDTAERMLKRMEDFLPDISE